MGRRLISRVSIKFLGPVVAALGFLAATAVTPALALPRTYQVQRISSTQAVNGGKFGTGVVNAGDINRDGEDDLLVAAPNEAGGRGHVYTVNGRTGAIMRMLAAPDPEPRGSDLPSLFGSYVGRIADLASCDGGVQDNPCAALGNPDGVPDILATAIGVDVPVPGTADTLVDAGRAYLIDGKTGALLRKIDMPAADLATQFAPTPFISAQVPDFGQTILSPASAFGATTASGPGDPAPAVQIGDLNGGGMPDVVVGAPGYFETDETAVNTSPCGAANTDDPSTPPDERVIDARCSGAGRAYVFYGESLTSPTWNGEADVTIKNPDAQPDDPANPSQVNSEALGFSIAPVGDLGYCISDPNGDERLGGDVCPASDTRDDPVAGLPGEPSLPDFLLSAHRADQLGAFDVGEAFLFDGRRSAVIMTYKHPEPQPASLFGFSSYNQPAVGDLGTNFTQPDVYLAASRQNNPFVAGGRGYAMNGAFKSAGTLDAINFAILNDPTPHAGENFGTASAGIGNVDSDPRTEVMVGAFGSNSPGTNENVVNDVHIFSALDERVLQTIEDPDHYAGSAFGSALAPLGDLNNDGFVDFAIASPRYGGRAIADEGRVYILRSDNSPAPPGPAPPGGGGGGGGTPVTLAGRALELEASPNKVRRGRRVRLRGLLEAFTNPAACQARQPVVIQRRKPGSLRYGNLAQVRTNGAGLFSATFIPRRTYYYRARVRTTTACLGAISARERVTVKRTKKRSAARTNRRGNKR